MKTESYADMIDDHGENVLMASSLDALAETLDESDLRLLKERFPLGTKEKFDMIRRKGFPYSYLDCSEKFVASFPEYGSNWINTLSGKLTTRTNYTRTVPTSS